MTETSAGAAGRWEVVDNIKTQRREYYWIRNDGTRTEEPVAEIDAEVWFLGCALPEALKEKLKQKPWGTYFP